MSEYDVVTGNVSEPQNFLGEVIVDKVRLAARVEAGWGLEVEIDFEVKPIISAIIGAIYE